MDFGSLIARFRGRERSERRGGAPNDVDTYFRRCALLALLRDLSARNAELGDVFDMAPDWHRLSARTTLRQSDFAAATGVLVKRLCLRSDGASGMFSFVIIENGAEALARLRAGDLAGLEAIVGPTAQLDAERRQAAAHATTTAAQRAIETDLAKHFAIGYNSVSQAKRVSWQQMDAQTAV